MLTRNNVFFLIFWNDLSQFANHISNFATDNICFWHFCRIIYINFQFYEIGAVFALSEYIVTTNWTCSTIKLKQFVKRPRKPQSWIKFEFQKFPLNGSLWQLSLSSDVGRMWMQARLLLFTFGALDWLVSGFSSYIVKIHNKSPHSKVATIVCRYLILNSKRSGISKTYLRCLKWPGPARVQQKQIF